MKQQLMKLLAGLFTALVLASQCTAQSYDENYARDRAEIEDLQSRYLFAFDWGNGAAYASTFTEDGVLDFAGGIVRGRKAIAEEINAYGESLDKKNKAAEPERPSRIRHMITNVVIKVEGDTALSRSYWWEFNDDMRDRRPYLGAYGHYEDELQRIDGQWLFSKRKIYNEQRAEIAAGDEFPAW